MHPWKVSIGITVTVLGLAAILGGAELSFIRPYWAVFLQDYALIVAVYGGIAIVTFAFSIYALARSLGLADLGRKVDLVSGRSGAERAAIPNWQRLYVRKRRVSFQTNH